MIEDWDLAISSLKRRLWLEDDPTVTENLQERVKQLGDGSGSRTTIGLYPSFSSLGSRDGRES